MICTPDYWAGDELVQIKTANIFARDFGEEGTDQVPLELPAPRTPQDGRHGSAAHTSGHCSEVEHLKRFLIERDNKKLNDLAEGERLLWDRIQHREPPPINGSEGAAAYLASKFENTRVSIDADEDLQGQAFEYLSVKAQLEDLEASKKSLRNQLAARLQEAGATVAAGCATSRSN